MIIRSTSKHNHRIEFKQAKYDEIVLSQRTGIMNWFEEFEPSDWDILAWKPIEN